jgi:hypothetical protein
MKVFHCDHCGQLVFFENSRCVSCGHTLAYLPDLGGIGSLEPADEEGVYLSPEPRAVGHTWRLCKNYTVHDVCNWAVPCDDDDPLCWSCRLTQVIPDLTQPGAKEAWYRVEVAKRRLVYSLLTLGLPVRPRETDDDVGGLAFRFLADPDDPKAPRVLTGHVGGLITLNIAEADDAERERRRVNLREPYRTLLGHFRHEVGHYYWDMLVAPGPRLDEFRELFGDEREDYGKALKRHYADGPPGDWQQRFVSTYASAHAWEDWAESWAHYLHMTDTLETAAACGLSLRPRRADHPALKASPAPRAGRLGDFDRLTDSWFSLTYVLNNLNRSLGLADGYPFVLSTPVLEKLRFIHETVDAGEAGTGA